MFAMRYCRKCLEGYRHETEGLGREEYLMLTIPVEDQFGVIMRARMTMMAGDFLNLLEGEEEVVDLAQHAQILGIEVPESPAMAHSYH